MIKIVLIIGPNGAGINTLCEKAKQHFVDDGRFHFVNRYVTKMPEEKGHHFFVSFSAFECLKENHFFISTWEAYGHKYGVSYDDMVHIPDGSIIVLPTSRSCVDEFKRRFPHVTTIFVTATAEVLKERMQSDTGEFDQHMEEKLRRASFKPKDDSMITIDTSSGIIDELPVFIEALEYQSLKNMTPYSIPSLERCYGQTI